MSPEELIENQILTTRKTCGLFNHPSRGILEIKGADSTSFLHHILSNDIKSLVSGRGTSACLLNAQAKIIALMNVLCFENFYWLACDYSAKNKLLDALGKLIIMEQVEVIDRSEEIGLISVHGPKATELVSRVIKETPPKEALNHISFSSSPSPHPLKGEEDKGEGVIVRLNMIGETGFALLIPNSAKDELRKELRQCKIDFDVTEIETPAFEVMRIEAVIPRYEVDFDESSIPLEAGLDKTVSFSKGCFPGQEILARLDSRGGVSKKLCGIVLKGEILPKKDDLVRVDGKEAGYITSSAFSFTLKKAIALAYLKKDYWNLSTYVVVETVGQQIPARVSPVPFYTP